MGNFAFQEMKETIINHVRYGGQQDIGDEEEGEDIEDELLRLTPAKTPDLEATPGKSPGRPPSRSPGKSPAKSPGKSPAKTPVIEDIDIDEIEDFFKESYSTSAATDEEMRNLKDELQKEQERVRDLEATLQGLKDEVVRLNTTITTNSKVTDTIQEQYLQ